MAQIELEHIQKTFRVARRSAGFGSALKSLLHRQYDEVHALQDVSFSVHEGEIVGYIGPNGAGKSSTIKLMSGILTPDSGICRIDGRIPYRDRIEHARRIGVVFGQRSQLWWDVPVADSFELIRDIYSVPDALYRSNLAELTELLALSEILRTPVRQLSLGQRMRCEIAASLLHSPRILFLDEPTIGLDSVSKIAVRDFIRRINKERGTTILITTHDMQDIEAMARRILLIGKGQILLDGSLEDLRRRFSDDKTISLEFSGSPPPLCEGLQWAELHQGRGIARVDNRVLTVSRAVSHLSGHTQLTGLSVASAGIDEIVVDLYREYGI